VTVEAAATYLTTTAPETGTWTVERVRGVVAYHRIHLGHPLGFTEGHMAPSAGEPQQVALVNNVTDASVTRYGGLLKSPFNGTHLLY
jgi:hypothetical protein